VLAVGRSLLRSPLLRPYFNCNGQRELAYRTSFRLFKGPIPKGAYVCHECDVSICVNPDQSTREPSSTTSLDAIERGRHVTRRHPDLLKALGYHLGLATQVAPSSPTAEIADICSDHEAKGNDQIDRGFVPCSTLNNLPNNRPRTGARHSRARKKRA